MNYRILIVDDDDDFRSLLSDLYTQADYQVKSVGNPLDALKLLSEESFALTVTDQSMPDLKGIDFIEKSRSFKPNMPIIMVSAYLSDDLSAKLRDQKVEVFHKPLNIMSLLRKTSELIKNANSDAPKTPSTASAQIPSNRNEPIEVEKDSDSAKKFNSFISFKSDAAKRLKKEIESIGNEIPNMVLVGDEGTHFQKICEDIQIQVDQDKHQFIFLINKKINVFDISKLISDVPPNQTLVFALTEAHQMGVAHKQALMKLHKRTGPFADIQNPIKFIFCLNEDLDTQFAKGAIDQDFYLIMGQKEIYIPRLNLCREDIVDIAQQIATELTQKKAVSENFGGFSSETTELFMQTEWKFNYDSLEASVAKALKLAKGSTITRDHLEKAIAEPEKLQTGETYLNAPQPHGSTDTTAKVEIKNKSEQLVSAEPAKESIAPSPKPSVAQVTRQNTTANPQIQSFTMLEDETELAKSVLSKLLKR